MKILPLILMILVSFIFTCEESADPANTPPEIEEIIFSPVSPVSNSSVTLNVVATDSDGDSLSYNWSAIAGTFSNSGIGNPMNWYITETGEIEITCIVSDGKETVSGSVHITVSQEVGSLSGFVQDAETGDYLEGANISLGDKTTMSLENGSYNILDIVTGTNQLLTASLQGYETYSGSIDIYSGERTRTIYLEKETGTISGYVYDVSTSQPVSGVQISIENRNTYSGDNGYYSLTSLVIGERIIWAMKYNYSTYSDTIQVAAVNDPYDIYIAQE